MTDVENVYYFLFLSIVIGFLLVYVLYLVSSVNNLQNMYNNAKVLREIVSQAYNAYYTGTYITNNTYSLERPCYTQYNNKIENGIICNNKNINLFYFGFPFLLDASSKNNYYSIERGEIKYGPISYYFSSVTNKRILFFILDINKKNKETINETNALFDFISLSFPTSNIIGFCSNNYYSLICKSTDIGACNRNDFLYFFKNYNSNISELYDALNKMGVNMQMGGDKCNIKSQLYNDYFPLSPQFIKIADNERKCKQNKECIVINGSSTSPPIGYYIFQGKHTRYEKRLNDIYDVMLLIDFKHQYFYYNHQDMYPLPGVKYRGMWINYMTQISKMMSIRYKIMMKKKYNTYYTNYAKCKDYFNNISKELCNNQVGKDSVCEWGENKKIKEYEKVKNMLKYLDRAAKNYYKEIALGCEESIYN